MASRTAVFEEAGPSGSLSPDRSTDRPRALPLPVLLAWCGLIAGFLEVGAIVLRKRTFEPNRLYWMSRHFVWLIPLLELLLFLVVGAVASVFVVCARRRGRHHGPPDRRPTGPDGTEFPAVDGHGQSARAAGVRGHDPSRAACPYQWPWLAARLLAALTLLPPVWAAFPRIYGAAGLLLALGIAARLVPMLERHADGFRRLVRGSFPVVAGLVPFLAASGWSADRLEAWRQARQPLPSPGSPNVLLIVLDTVGADHLGLHGYDRPTSPTLEELARRGIRFDRAQATSSWTLPSHASLFTGRWPHELSVGWFTPLDRAYPTLAESLGSRGYATAGFVANYWYCASDSGLARGFTAYRDFTFPRLTAFKTTVLVDRLLEGVEALEAWCEEWLDFEPLSPAVDLLWWLFESNRKAAEEVHREFLDWLSLQHQPERPFFAFLNLYDAHYPYELPEKRLRRFGSRPRNDREAGMLRDWPRLIEEGPSPRQIGYARDAYDNCVADLDEQLGRLIDELDRRSILGRTWVIITADHGESFGEQPGVFFHGTSLYQAQVHVPLVIVPPPGGPSPGVVAEAVSLRDLPATILDVLGLGAGSTIPGESLARFWGGSSPARSASRGTVLRAADHHRPNDHPTELTASAPVLAELVPIQPFDRDPSSWLTTPRWPMAALTLGDWKYIRREGDIREELFHLRDDSQERHNRAGEPALQPVLERMRGTLGRLTAGPLTPQRFNP